MAGGRFSKFLHLFVSSVLSVCLLLAQGSSAQELNGMTTLFSFRNNSFDTSNITLLQTAYIGNSILNRGPNTLILTPNMPNVSGRALYYQPIRLRNAVTRSVLQFSTHFSFAALKSTEKSSEGIAFIIAVDKETTGQDGGYMGFLNNSTNGDKSGRAFAIEFDSGLTEWCNDPDNNHIGIDINNMTSWFVQGSGSYSDDTWVDSLAQIDLSVDNPVYVWIDYNYVLNVTISKSPNKPDKPLISRVLPLSDILNEFMHVGLTSATENFDNQTDNIQSEVYDWSFSTGGDVYIPGEILGRNRKDLVVILSSVSGGVSLVLIAAALWCGLYYRKREGWRRRVTQLTELDRLPDHFGAHKIRFKDLSHATGKFSDKAKLGKGGFGWVYKGVLPGTNIEVAVKRVGRTSRQGAREFMSEVKIIGRMRHRNLVPLLGWCHHKSRGELLLVYEYMPNGSLDHKLFRKDGVHSAPVLSWEQRAKILTGVATALHFLHEEYDLRVVHRDVKAGNVMLDADFNARLGDFGLARLYDHSQPPQPTTTLAGTLGYMAPELFEDGKSTEKTDVYSFGALALEIAAGQEAAKKFPEGKTLVDWVWSHFSEGNIMAAADINLETDFDEKEMELVLLTGLLCSHPDPDQRPTMQQSLSYLKKEARFPIHTLPPHRPRLRGGTPQAATSQFWLQLGAQLNQSSLKLGHWYRSTAGWHRNEKKDKLIEITTTS